MTISAETPMLTAQDIRNVMQEEFTHFLTDIEFRVAQAYDMENGRQKIYAEDIASSRHQITGYTVTSNSPAAGSIAWVSVFIVYNGVTYTLTNGNSANMYVWFDAATSATALQSSNTKPTLSGNSCMVFLNNGGTAVSVLENNDMPPVVANNAIDGGAVQNLAITAGKVATGTLTSTQISSTANITGTQLSSTAGITGTQISGTANLLGSQFASNANIVGTQLTTGTIGSTQLGAGAVTPAKTAIFQHMIY